MPVDVQVATTLAVPACGRIVEWAGAALGCAEDPAVRAGRVDVCIRVVDAEESAALNAQYRNRSGPTNVLSFSADVACPESEWPVILSGEAVPHGESAGAEVRFVRPLGDLVICAPVVAAEAGSQGKAPDAHFAHMVVHGILHLLGYDHESASEAERMEQLERAVLARFEIGDPYREG